MRSRSLPRARRCWLLSLCLVSHCAHLSPREQADRAATADHSQPVATLPNVERAEPVARRSSTSKCVLSLDRLLALHGLPLTDQPNACIAMSVPEASTLLSLLLRPNTRTYLEWGSGGSTELVSHLILAGLLPHGFHAYSVESSLSWIDYMRERSDLIRQAVAKGSLTFLHGSLGKTGHLGYPEQFTPGDDARVLSYVALSEKIRRRKLDLVLVDGRFRLACALEARKHLNVDEGGLLMLHDYILKPPGLPRARFNMYSKALGFYHLVQRNESLAVFSSRRHFSQPALDSLFQDALKYPD
ncbi:MAG: hypothetical protein SGPRY_013745 [Prymnesium sp.]